MKKYLLLLATASMMAMAACDKDNNSDPTVTEEDKDKDKDKDKDNGNTTVAEDKVNIQASFDKVKNILQSFNSGELYKFTDEFFDYHEEKVKTSYGYTYSEYVISDFVELLGEKLGDELENSVDDERFKFESAKGTYTWNGAKWDKTQNNNAIVAKFPAAEGKTNTCELAMTKYTDKKCDIEGETIYLPTAANAYLKKDNEMLASVDITANFTSYGIPKEASGTIYAKPINVATSLKQETASKYSASVSITDETSADNNLSVSGEVTLSNSIDQYADFDDCGVNVLRFTVKQSDLTITGTIDAKTLEAISSPSVEEINSCMTIEVLYRGNKTGTLNVKELGRDNERFLYITYKDGTQENTSMYYDSFVEDVKAMYKKYWDN
jgi:hypothetical protein